ncbi:hypothetical protein ACHQM5_029152 [Ranunculus cassubicifolius]
MASGLDRSTSSYRRQGSSGLVWENRFSGDLTKMKIEGIEFRELRPSKSVGSLKMMQRSGSTGGQGYRSKQMLPEYDPPSPKAITCSLWKLFGKKKTQKKVVKQKS